MFYNLFLTVYGICFVNSFQLSFILIILFQSFGVVEKKLTKVSQNAQEIKNAMKLFEKFRNASNLPLLLDLSTWSVFNKYIFTLNTFQINT